MRMGHEGHAVTAQQDSNHLKLSVANLGPIAGADIELRPMTVFVGPSNTGKSYLAMLIYALHRFFGNHYPQSIRLGPGSTISRRLESELSSTGSLTLEKIAALARWTDNTLLSPDARGPILDAQEELPEFAASLVRSILRDVAAFSVDLSHEVQRCFGIVDVRGLARHGSSGGPEVLINSPASDGFRLLEPFRYSFTMKRGKGELTSTIPDENPLLTQSVADSWLAPFNLVLPVVRQGLESLDEAGRHRALADLVHLIIGLVFPSIVGPLSRRAHYLPADRTGIMHAHLVAVASLIERAPLAALETGAHAPEVSGVIADFLTQLVRLGNTSTDHIEVDGISDALERKMLGGKIGIGATTMGYPKFHYRPDGWRTNMPLMHTSSMVSELAPVVLYLRHIVRPGQLLIIEEPESHLHPKLQVDFIRHLAAVVRSGVRVMITTHSEWVLDELTNLVRLSDLTESDREAITGSALALSPDDLGVWLFEPKKRPRGSVVKEIEFDEDFGGYRTGFDEVAIGTYNHYVAISNRISEARAEYNPG